MPNIDAYLAKIREAVYGEEVRGSIHDAIQAINNEVVNSDQVHLRNSIAEQYSSSNAYKVGEYAFYPSDGILYRCIKDGTGQTPSSGSAYWRAVELTEDYTTMASAIAADEVALYIEGNRLLSEWEMRNGYITGGGSAVNSADDYRAYYSKAVRYPFPVVLKAKTGVRFSGRIYYYSTGQILSDYCTSSAQLSFPLTIPANQYFSLFVRKYPDETTKIDVSEAITWIYLEPVFVSKSGHAVNKVLCTDDNGEIVEDDIDANNNLSINTLYRTVQNGMFGFYGAGLRHGTIYSGGTPADGANNYTVYSSNIQKYPFSITINTKGIYRARVFYYSEPPMNNDHKLSDTLVTSSTPLIVPANQYFGFYFYIPDSTDYLPVDDAFENIYISSAFDDIASLIEYKENEGLVLPYYWETYMETKIPELKYVEENINSGVEFIFITDVHMPRNTLNSPALIRRIVRDTNMPFVINGGDWLDTSATRQDGLDLMYHWRDLMHKVPEYCIIGNHDLNQVGNTDPDVLIPEKCFYNVMTKTMEKEMVSNNQLYFYFDNDNQKFRWIILSPRFDGTQKAWLQSKLTELDETWTVLVMSHYLWNDPQTFSPIGQQYMSAINEVYSSIDANLIGIMAGHAHFDTVQSEPTYGYKLISTTTDTIEYGDLPKARGTTAEHAFDAVYIDTQEKKVYMKRIGIGNDRTISY